MEEDKPAPKRTLLGSRTIPSAVLLLPPSDSDGNMEEEEVLLRRRKQVSRNRKQMLLESSDDEKEERQDEATSKTDPKTAKRKGGAQVKVKGTAAPAAKRENKTAFGMASGFKVAKVAEEEAYDYDGTYACVMCTESVRGTAALHCAKCSSNPFHQKCVSGSVFAYTCPQCARKSVVPWTGGRKDASAAPIMDEPTRNSTAQEIGKMVGLGTGIVPVAAGASVEAGRVAAAAASAALDSQARSSAAADPLSSSWDILDPGFSAAVKAARAAAADTT